MGTVVIGLLVGVAPGALAQEEGECGLVDVVACGGEGSGTGFNFGGKRAGSPTAGGLPARPVSTPESITETKLVPTCDGNDAVTDIGLCPGAVETCPIPGDVNFWVYRRTYVAGTTPPPFARVLTPPSVCLGPEDPQVDPIVAIPAIVQREFKRVVVLKGVANVDPAPETLVNLETRFTTDAPTSYDIPLTILGQSVVITATAVSYTWHFGDGATARLTGSPATAHTYASAGSRGAYVVIEWSGTYRVGGDPTVRQVVGTATTTGDTVQVQVRQARTELVDQPG